jgi:hypothetical protein
VVHDQHAKAGIQSIKAARKHVDDLVDPYYERFIKRNPPDVPTKKDAEDYERLVKAGQANGSHDAC